MVDELSPSPVDPAVLLVDRKFGCQVESAGVASVGDAFAAGSDLRAWGSEKDLGGGGLRVVVHVAQQDRGCCRAGIGEDAGHVDSQRRRFRGPLLEGEGAEAGSLVFVTWLEATVGVGQQFALEVSGDELDGADPGIVTVIWRNPRLGAVAVPPVSSDCTGASPGANAATSVVATMGIRDATTTRIPRGSR